MIWKSVCCAVQGRGHAKNNIPCQDKVAKLEANGVQVIVLADGSGSAKFSHFGAERVVTDVAGFIVEKFSYIIAQEDGRNVTRELLIFVLNQLEKESSLHNCTIKDLASTLLIAAVNEKNFFLAHLGDGVIGYLNDKGLKTVSAPDNGEFANETFFVTSSSAAAHMRIYKGELKNICGFVLMSDGTEQSLYNKKNKTLALAIKRLMHRTCLIDDKILTPQLEEALNSVVVSNTHDDCSIALLARTSEQLPPLEKLPLQERQKLFQTTGLLFSRKIRQKIFSLDKICALLKTPMTLRQLSQKLYLKERFVKRKLLPLLDAGIITKKGTFFETYCQ